MFGKKPTAKKTGPSETELEYLQSIIDSSPDAIQVFRAYRDQDGKIVDFTWLAQNKKGFEQNGHVTGKRALELNPGMVVSGIFDRMRFVVESGVPYEEEQYYSFEQFSGNWYYLTLVKFDDGIIMTTKDITRYKRAGEELLQAKEKLAKKAVDRYEMLLNSIDEGFCIIEMMFDSDGKSYDYRFLEVNTAFEKQTGLINPAGKTIRSLAPGQEQHWFDIYGRVARTGEAERFEHTMPATSRHYEIHAFPVDHPELHHVAVLFSDITVRKNAEQPV